MRTLLLGGTGFIGRHVVPILGSSVRVGVHRRQPAWLPPAVERVDVDVLEADTVRRAMAGVDVVINLTGQIADDFDEVVRVNRLGSQAVASAAAAAGVRRLVHLSTAQVYGEEEAAAETTPVAPRSPYAELKLAAEDGVRPFEAAGSLVILRASNVYGAGQSAGFMGSLRRAAQEGTAVIVTGDGTQRRDFVHVADVARVLRTTSVRDVPSGVYNIGAGVTHSLLGVLDTAADVLGRRLPHELRPQADPGPKVNGVATAKARAALGWEPLVDLRAGLRMTLLCASRGKRV